MRFFYGVRIMKKLFWVIALVCLCTACDDDSSDECSGNEHRYNNACEANSLENCGSHGNDCSGIVGWKAGECNEGKCVVTECAENYVLKDGKCEASSPAECGKDEHAYDGNCEANSLENCGSHGNACSGIVGWKDGNCTEGKCVVTECAENYVLKGDKCEADVADIACAEGKHEYEGGCEADSTENCGSHGNACAASTEGWKDGACTEGKCVATECAENYELKGDKCEAISSVECGKNEHENEGKCEADSLEHCGSHDNACASTEGWKDGACTEGKCVVTECAENYELKGDKCEAITSVECGKDEHEHEGKCEADSLEHCGSYDNACASIKGWKEGDCTEGKCVATKCTDDYHVYQKSCEANDEWNCGSHLKQCQKSDVPNSTGAACNTSIGRCYATSCCYGYNLSGGLCHSICSDPPYYCMKYDTCCSKPDCAGECLN